jgi:hypothetical protein
LPNSQPDPAVAEDWPFTGLVCNRRHQHFALGMISSVEFEDQLT